METELDEYVKWMADNNHDIGTFDDYEGIGLECTNRKCIAGRYDWESTHVEMFRKERGN